MLVRQLYYRSPGRGVAPWHNVAYRDAKGLARVEIIYHTTGSDEDRDWIRRESPDNGRTWSEFTPMDGVVEDTPRGGIAWFYLPTRHNPATGDAYIFTMVRHWPGRKVFDYSHVNGQPVWTEHMLVSENGGPNQMLRYEDGPEFDPNKPDVYFGDAFFKTNTAYYSHLPQFGPRGEVYYPVFCYGRPIGSQKTVRLFRREPASGKWLASNAVGVTREQSGVGLEEPEVALLKNGTLMIVARGDNDGRTPGLSGVKWMTRSTDGGRTLEPVEELRYDDGSRLHSPCSIFRFLRSTRNGKLYFVGNILPKPCTGQEPRYPLCIAEIDENKAAVVKSSVEVLDDRRPGEPERLQISNFHVIEDRETLDFELYVTLLGLNAQDFWGCDVYKYVYKPR